MFTLRTKEERYGLALVLLFIVSRLLFSLKGGTFLATPLTFAKQFLDPELLQNDLLRSLFYLHAQPPLFNFFLGSIMKISPLPAVSFEVLFKTAGIVIPLLFFGILTTLGTNSLIAFIATLIFMFNPTLILYENLLYYTYVEALCILLALFFLLQWLTSTRLYFLILFWISLLWLGMMRSLFHPVFFLITSITLALYLACKAQQQRLAKQLLLASLIVLIPISLVCVKNGYLYGFLGTSSWDGMSLWIKVNGYAPETLEEYYTNGIISQKALRAGLETFKPISHYFTDDELKNIPCHHPADCNEWKSSGKPNYNHSGYVSLSKQLWKDALSLIAEKPQLFAYYTFVSYSLMLWHASDSVHALFMKNMQIVERVEEMYRFLYGGFLGVESKRSTHYRWWVRTYLITGLFLLFYGSTLYLALKKRNAPSYAILTVCLFCFLIHIYTLLTSSFIEFGENNRFRFPVDPAFLVLMAGNIVIWKNILIRRGAAGGGEG
jgi:hypothetical protein